MSSKLKPLELTDEVDTYKAFEEKKDIEFKGCTHKDIKIQDGEIRCSCGAAWGGSQLNKLYDILKKDVRRTRKN